MQVLLAHKANVNHVTKYGIFPLYRAAESGYKDIVQMLLEAGADQHLKTSLGITLFTQMEIIDFISPSFVNKEIIKKIEKAESPKERRLNFLSWLQVSRLRKCWRSWVRVLLLQSNSPVPQFFRKNPGLQQLLGVKIIYFSSV